VPLQVFKPFIDSKSLQLLSFWIQFQTSKGTEAPLLKIIDPQLALATVVISCKNEIVYAEQFLMRSYSSK